MAEFKHSLSVIQNNSRVQAVCSFTVPHCLAQLGYPTYLFTYYVIYLHHVIAVIFVYILIRHTVWNN